MRFKSLIGVSLFALFSGTLWSDGALESIKPLAHGQADQTSAYPDRMVVLPDQYQADGYHPPVEFVTIKEGSEPVISRVSFKAGDDWLKNLSITVKNVSTKNIVRVEVHLTFLDTGDGTRGRPYLLMDGVQLGKTQDNHSHAANPPLDFQPGQELTLPFVSGLGDLSEGTVGQPLSTIRRVQVTFSIFFADGTKWRDGVYEKPNPAKVGRYSGYSVMSFEQWKQYSAAH